MVNYKLQKFISVAVWDNEITILHELSGDTYFYTGLEQKILSLLLQNKSLSKAQLVTMSHDTSMTKVEWIDYIDSAIESFVKNDLLI
ncbi:MAG: hypothetical protein CTY19_03070 [Methylomonas sp.]|jgi:hypothetical protein|nr:MAG: hypothetical protein CTY19_03070 [Methylomonas sp.]